jgi:hypothetical protein
MDQEDQDHIRDAEVIVEELTLWKKMTEKVVGRDASGQTLLHHAASNNDAKKISRLLQYGADISVVDNSGFTPLHNAALNGHDESVEILLNYGSVIDPMAHEDETPLHDACKNGHLMVVLKLLQFGAKSMENKRHKFPADLTDDQSIKNLFKKDFKPYQKAEFYPRLINTMKQDKNIKPKREEPKPVRLLKKNQYADRRSFAWGGLDDTNGPFESSREEKKFKALWQTLVKTEDRNSDNSSGDNKEARPEKLDGRRKENKERARHNSMGPEGKLGGRRKENKERFRHGSLGLEDRPEKKLDGRRKENRDRARYATMDDDKKPEKVDGRRKENKERKPVEEKLDRRRKEHRDKPKVEDKDSKKRVSLSSEFPEKKQKLQRYFDFN